MNGTEWTELGAGATLNDLVCAALDAIDTGRMKHPGVISPYLRTHPESVNAQTNLRLTGAPLTAYDLRRIEECEVEK